MGKIDEGELGGRLRGNGSRVGIGAGEVSFRVLVESEGVRCRSRGKRTKREGERKKTWGGKPQNDKTAEFRVRVTNVYYLILYYLYKTHDDLRLKKGSRDSFNEEVRKEEVVKCCFACSSSIEQSAGEERVESSVSNARRCEERLAKLTLETVPDLQQSEHCETSSARNFAFVREMREKNAYHPSICQDCSRLSRRASIL